MLIIPEDTIVLSFHQYSTAFEEAARGSLRQRTDAKNPGDRLSGKRKEHLGPEAAGGAGASLMKDRKEREKCSSLACG